MTSRERFLIAMQNGIADRVPCAPDISNYIPCKRTQLPFWEIYFDKAIPLYKAYSDAASFYGIDMWIASVASIPYIYDDSHLTIKRDSTYDKQRDAMYQITEYNTPDGVLEEKQVCFRHEPPMHVSRIIKNIEEDWKRYKWLLRTPIAIDTLEFNRMRTECESKGQAFGCFIGYPGFHSWEGFIEGGIETLTYLDADTPHVLEQWFEKEVEVGTVALELYLAQKPDYVLFGGSGTLTMASPPLIMKYVLPALKKWIRMAKEAHVPTMLHSCGKSRTLIDILVKYTDLDCINPLEIAPMGDVDLKEVKATHGKSIALMGNLHTTSVMLYGSPDEVYEQSRKAINDAKENGGFILSTGDQCPIDTPDENIFAMVQAAKDFGSYEE